MGNFDASLDRFDALSVSLLRISSRSLRRSAVTERPPSAGLLADPTSNTNLQVIWAKHQDEVVAAQKLRYQVFCTEMGAKAKDSGTGQAHIEQDEFDEHCEHLLVKDRSTGKVVGTYRLLMPYQARRLNQTYIETQFDMYPLRHLRENMVELGRSCVHPDYRNGAVIRLLGGAIFKFMKANQFDHMVGCASIPMTYQGHRGGDAAASIWAQLKQSHWVGEQERVTPHLPLPLEQLNPGLEVEPPALISAYLRMGAKLLGPPSWDPEFNTADLPILAKLADLPVRFRQYFLGE